MQGFLDEGKLSGWGRLLDEGWFLAEGKLLERLGKGGK
jgi:hypothetical protein